MGVIQKNNEPNRVMTIIYKYFKLLIISKQTVQFTTSFCNKNAWIAHQLEILLNLVFTLK
jgi:hypothetical protein